MMKTDFIDKIREEFVKVAREFRDGIEAGLEDGAAFIIHGNPKGFWVRASYGRILVPALENTSSHERESILVEAAYINQAVLRTSFGSPINFGELDKLLESFIKTGPEAYFSHFQATISFFLKSDVSPNDLNELVNSIMVSEIMKS
jgi:hypothetical protein